MDKCTCIAVVMSRGHSLHNLEQASFFKVGLTLLGGDRQANQGGKEATKNTATIALSFILLLPHPQQSPPKASSCLTYDRVTLGNSELVFLK